MKKKLHTSFLKCISSDNKTGVTFIEVVFVELFAPIVVRNIKNYVDNLERNSFN